MSIASELTALNGYILDAYDEINTRGGTVPANKNMANLVSAIASIPKRKALPEGYTEVEWLQSSSGVYILLDYYPHADTTFDILWAYKGNDTKALAIFGAGQVGSGNPTTRPNYVLTSTSSAALVGMYYSSSWSGFSPSVDISTGNDIRFRSTVDSETFRVYTEGGARNFTYREFTCDAKLSLFSAGGNNRTNDYRIYYAKFFEDGGTVLDLVPAVRDSDNEPGMYDLANKVFYTNNGSGSFTTGPAIY